MFEIILGIIAILGFVFMMCKFIGKVARVFGLREISTLLDESLSMRMGNLSARKKD
ncbi:MAG TPA: hypothetical protein VK880_02970 [Anaerolineales bacterium]|nr:hypothetical protein [Anaerolineales bacterium]